MSHRVVVTGVGCVSSVGHSLQDAWQAAVEGRTGIKTISIFDTTDYDVHIGADIPDWDPTQYMDGKEAKRCDRFTQFAVVAAEQALAQSGLTITPENEYEVGVICGCGIGGMLTWEEQFTRLLHKGPSRVSPFLVPVMIVDMAAGMISMRTGAKGPNYATVSACASATHAMGNSFETIRRGAAKAVITGGTEGAISPTGLSGFCAAKALSTRNDEPSTACRPFDKTRDGFVMGEGACIMILEELEYARARGANILAEIVGFGMSGDAYNMVAPDPKGEAAARAMQAAMKEAELEVTDIDYVNAHAPGTPGGDDMEARALQLLYAGKDYSPIVSSTKSVHGHMLGATGAMELSLSIKMMHENLVPKTLNCHEPDDDIWIDVVREENREAHIDTIMSNSFGFGGHNAVIIARRYAQ